MKHRWYQLVIFNILFAIHSIGQSLSVQTSAGVQLTNGASCPNMGFEQTNFTNWSGSYGTTVAGTISPNYITTSNVIVNSGGNNIALASGVNYHTIMTTPSGNRVYPLLSGYDSLACRTVGTSTISDVPFISPYSRDNVSVRMNGAIANYRACMLKYVTTTSATNRTLSYSFAAILDAGGHTPDSSPYFKVSVWNESTNTQVAGCGTSILINPASATAADSLITSAIMPAEVVYRKWQNYIVDLSSLPLGTQVSVNFEVGGCSNGGHFGYAYVDAECGDLFKPLSNWCSGTASALLVAPLGYTYQWRDVSHSAIPGATNDTLIVSSPSTGDVYSVDMSSAGGCVINRTDTVKVSSVQILSVNTSSTCPGGFSGSATVNPAGSNGLYVYNWVNTSTGQGVSGGQQASSLSAGNYSVIVSSLGCGSATAAVSISNAPPNFITRGVNICGQYSQLYVPGFTNYDWYYAGNPIAAPAGNNDTLVVYNPIHGDSYTLAYTSTYGCRDSIDYVFVNGVVGSVFAAITKGSCQPLAAGSVTVNISPAFLSRYQYEITDASQAVIASITTSLTSTTINNISPGSYTVTVSDSNCVYQQPLIMPGMAPDFTVTATHTLICQPADSANIHLSINPSNTFYCGLGSSPCPATNTITLFSSGTFTQNAYNTYPTPFGAWYSFNREQYLIRKSDLNAAGLTAGPISNLAFRILALNSSQLTYHGYSIKMGCTGLDSLPSSDNVDQYFVAGLQPVYYAANQSIALGWNTFVFTQPYMWDGHSNIIVEICSGNAAFSYTQNTSIELVQMPYVSTLHSANDAYALCGTNNQTGYYNMTTNAKHLMPNMKFGICGASGAPSSYSISMSSNANVVNNYSNDSLDIKPSTLVPGVSDTYTVSLTDPTTGCVTTKPITLLFASCTDVWPGDANSDGTADNLDVLELGLHYTQSGPARSSTSNSWQSYYANSWTGTITNGQNLNHSDCNGDGVIHASDTLAIYLNYGLTHAFKQNQTTTSNPDLTIVPDQPSVNYGNWGTASIYLGDATNPVNAINGVAYTVTFDHTLIDPNNIYLEYLTSFVNATNQNLHFRKLDFNNNVLYTATTHTLSSNVSGNGKIAVLHYKIRNTASADTVLNIGITSGYKSDVNGAIAPLTTGASTVQITSLTTNVETTAESHAIRIYPNPARDYIIISGAQPFTKVELKDVTGRTLIVDSSNTTKLNVSVDGLTNGVYFIEVYSQNSVVKRQKVVIQK